MTSQLQVKILAMLESQCDARELADQWEAGRQMSVGEAVAYALTPLD
jgi:hypothetical protein